MADEKAEKPMTQLNPHRFHTAEYKRNVYVIYPEHETPVDALLDPAYWAHVAAKLRPLDWIEVHAEDGSWFARFLVRDSGKLYAKVARTDYVKFDEDVEVQQMNSALVAAGYAVKWRGPQLRWCVVRGKDTLKDGMEKAQANTWLSEHLRTVGT